VAAQTEVDAGLFRSLAGQGRAAARAGQVTGAAELFGQALGLWRGAALADVVGLCPRLAGDAASLEELRAGVVEERLECDLALGRHAEVAAEGPGLVAAFPLRERLAGQVMVALYRCGRRGEALAVFDTTRRVLAQELGLDPGPELTGLQAKILADDPSLTTPPPAEAAATDGPQAVVVAAGTGAERGLPNDLPAQLGTFIGRDWELSEVRALVESSRLVTLTGPGGCGKTRLSLQLAAGLLDGFPDGVWLVELAAITSEDAVPTALTEALGIARQPGRPVLGTLLDALAPQDMLIVLDNCEHLIDACAKTADAIMRRCPRVHLVATSRELLGIGGETIYRVPPLSLPGPGETGVLAAESSDAVALFVDRAKAQGTGLTLDEETAPLAVSTCRRLDGLPLAIELAAARLRTLSLTGLHDRLGQRLRLLTGGDRTALARQQTLEATVEWSYELLTGAEQVLLRRLSIFADSFDLEAAEAVGGFGGIAALDVTGLLGSLVDKSLVVAEPTGPALRYRLLETIRQFAAERLTDGSDEIAAVEAAYCGHCLSVAETAAPYLTGPDQGTWFARLDADQVNIRRAAEYAARRPDGTEQVLRLSAALQRYWRARDRDEEALALLMPVLDRPDAQKNPELFGTALVTAVIAARLIDIQEALRLGEQAVTLSRQLDAGRLLIQSLAALCFVCALAGDLDRGLPPGREAVERARQLGDDVLLGESLTQYLFLECDAVINPAQASPLIAEAIACTQRSGDHLFAYNLNNIAGKYALRTGDIPTARACLQQAAAHASRAFGGEGSDTLLNMGWMLRQDHDPDGARASFQKTLQIGRHNGERFNLAYAILGLACLAADAADWPRGAVLHGAAQTILDTTGLPWQELEARYRQDSLDQMRAHLSQQQFEQAYAKGAALSPDQAFGLASEKVG
jgi:predicted ATPase